MSSVQYLREFISERLTAAAEEIFQLFEKTIIEYQEEIDRQRRRRDGVGSWKTGKKLHMKELPEQHVCKEEVLTDQQLCNQDRNSSLDRGDPDPPQIKQEQEELYASQDVEELVLKQETDTFTLTPTYEESDDSEPEQNSDSELLSHSFAVVERQDLKGIEHVDSGSTINLQLKPNRQQVNTGHTNDVDNCPMSEIHCNTHTGEKSIECDFCGKAFKYKYNLKRHLRIHTGEKPFVCNTCGKRYSQMSILKRHMKIHTGEKPYSCKICRKRFCQKTQLQRHMNIHTRGEANT